MVLKLDADCRRPKWLSDSLLFPLRGLVERLARFAFADWLVNVSRLSRHLMKGGKETMCLNVCRKRRHTHALTHSNVLISFVPCTAWHRTDSVSYTHLDVYKRQTLTILVIIFKIGDFRNYQGVNQGNGTVASHRKGW